MPATLQEIPIETVSRIVEAAVRAPSAENLQPWHFQFDGEALVVSLDNARTLRSDVENMLSLVGIGAAIENAVIAASAHRLASEVNLVTEPQPVTAGVTLQTVARIHFSPGASTDPLAEFIGVRATGRRMNRRRLAPELRRRLERCCQSFRDVQFHWVSDDQISKYARLMGRCNRLRFEYEPYHRELYETFRFSKREAEKTRDGLDVATLQLPLGVGALLWYLRTWRRMQWANRLGFSRGVDRQAAREIKRSGAVGFLTVPTLETKHVVHAGRALERIWLTSARHGLVFHPTASLPVFLARAGSGSEVMDSRLRKRIQSLPDEFRAVCPDIGDRMVAIAFRLGYGHAPATRTLRRVPTIEFQSETGFEHGSRLVPC